MAAELEPIAIIGLAAQLPGKAKTLETLWDIILAGESTVSEVPKDRFNIDTFYHQNLNRLSATSTKYGNFLDRDLGAFDAGFFNTPPQEAESIDPAQRILLETAYHALENAGIPMESVAGSNMACYVGASGKDYESLLLRDPDYHAKYTMTGIGTAMLANRVSWFFDLRGASFTLDTGCSGSVIALHQACAALRARESDSALVGGSNLSVVPDAGIVPLSNMGFLSPDGRCWSFDSRANGFGRADGQGFIVLKRLSDAVRDGDVIRAVVRSTALNQDGHTPGLTMPSAESQYTNVMAAYQAAGLDIKDTAYFEAHGTGTQVGDLIESQAIHKAFNTSAENPLYVGSVKANIGHLEAAAGLGGIFKSIHMLEKGLIPREACPADGEPNPKIPFDQWGLKVAPSTVPWPTEGLRRISLNSFGYGGSNAHAILDDPLSYLSKRGLPGHHLTKASKKLTNGHSITNGNGVNGHTNGHATNSNGVNGHATNGHGLNGHSTNGDATPQSVTILLTLSAADEAGIERLATTLENHFASKRSLPEEEADKYLASLAFTLSERRSRLPWKSFLLASSLSELQEGLITKVSKPIRSSIRPPSTYIFSGQGANYAKMGVDLIPVHRVFRESIEKSDRLMRELGSDWSLIDELHKSSKETRVFVPKLSQPLATALQVALFDLVESWGLSPTTVIGHSSGEIAAAYSIGAIDHESAIKVAYFRGVVADNLEKSGKVIGTMASVGLSEEEIAPYIAEMEKTFGPQCIQVACVNSNVNVTLTGLKTALDGLSDVLEKKSIFCRRLAITVPYHSIHMNLVSDEYVQLMGKLELKHPKEYSPKGKVVQEQPVMFSSVTKQIASPESLRDPQYWVDNLVGQVKFYPALKELIASTVRPEGCSGQILEVAPHAVLQRSIRDILVSLKQEKNFEYESLLFRNNPATTNCMNAVGRLACRNVPVNIANVNNPTLDKSTIAPLASLPNYPFNHTQSYWHESRISKNHRFRKYGRHELIGNRVTDWNPLEPRWRNFLNIGDIAWLQEATVEDKTIIPPAALLTMPVEALRQLHDYSNSFSAYQLSDVSFVEPLVFAAGTKEKEIQTVLRPVQVLSNGSDTYKFTVYAWEDNESQVLCNGTLSGTLRTEKADARALSQTKLDEFAAECTESVDPKVFYKNIGSMGYVAGPSYQKASSNLKFNDQGKAIAKLDLSRNAVPLSNTFEDVYLLHPTSLEAVLQSNKAAIANGSLKPIPRLQPTSLKSLHISAQFESNSQPALSATTKVAHKGFREVETNVVAVDSSLIPLVSASGLWEASDFNLDSFQAEPDLHVSSISWKPDITQLSNDQIVEHVDGVSDQLGLAAPPQVDVDQQELVSLHAVKLALEAIDRETAKGLPDFLQRFYAWMEHIMDQKKYESLLATYPLFANPETRAAYLEELTARDATAELLNETSKALVPILRGEMDGLDLLFNSGLADRFYRSGVHDLAYNRISSFVDLKAHKNPELKILEIGAGTGGATRPTLQALSNAGVDKDILRFSEYCFTDISPAFFEKARENFASTVSRMVFKPLDISKEPVTQGFEENKYDLIVASLVLHATPDLRNTLKNVRSLLKEGGQLILYETTGIETSRVGLTFGLVPGWWLGVEPERQLTPCASTEGWHQALIDTGFTGVDFDLPDHNTVDHKSQSVLVATAKGQDPAPTGTSENVVLIVNDNEPDQTTLAETIAQTEGTDSVHFTISTLQQLAISRPENTTFVSLLETQQSFLKDINEPDFNTLKLILTAPGVRVIWVTRGCGLSAENPDLGMFTGLGRTLTTERLDCKYTELSLEETDVATTAATVWTNLKRSFDSRVPHEPEVSYSKGVFYIPRVVPSTGLNRHLRDQLVRPEPEPKTLETSKDRPLTLSIKTPGHLETLRFVDTPNANVALAADEVIVQVLASGLTLSDYLVAQGQATGTGFGNEFSGVVASAGASSGFAAGDQVFGYSASGSLGTHVRVRASTVAKLPPSISTTNAVAISFAFAAAYYQLVKIARLDASDKVLIHSGASIAGLAAAQVAEAIGATVYLTVDSQDDLSSVSKCVKTPEERIYTSEDAVLPEFDVVLNLNNVAERFSSWLSISDGGKFIEASDIESPAIRQACNASVSYAKVDFRAALESGSAKTAGLLDAVAALMPKGGYGNNLPSPQVISIADLETAFDKVHEIQSNGKVVVEIDESATVQVVPALRVPHKFTENASYVIAGGFGGLGRALIPWMAERGARNFIVLSRSGASSEAAKNLVKEMNEQGVRIEGPKCDLTSVSSVTSAIESVKGSMPPIKGALQAAMILADSVFENMTHAQWLDAIQPKVQGTWALHAALPRGMEFFIMFSSIAGVMGSPGQSNYAAGNTFQDALARHRRAQGEHGIALDLGAISGVGAAAERNLDDELRRRGMGGMPKPDLLACLEYCFSPGLADYPEVTQMVTGLGYFTTLSLEKKDEIAWSNKPLYSVLRHVGTKDTAEDDAGQEKAIPPSILLKAAEDDADATDIVLQALRGKLSRVLSVPAADIDTSLPIYASGVDSLIALEVRNWFAKEISADVPISELMRDQSLYMLAGQAAKDSGFRAGAE